MADEEENNDLWAEARQKVEGMEDDPPKKLEDWPSDEGKYVTFGGSEGDHGYDEGPEKNLGPSSIRRFEDGSVEVDGEMAENPDDYKSDEGPITIAVEKNPKPGTDEDERSGGDADGDDSEGS